MEFYLQTLDFAAARTQSYFNHTGIFYTETKTLFGAFAINDYGSNASTRTSSAGLPRYLESNGYIHYDYGGNSGGTEVSLMILDHWLYTQNMTALQRFFPIVSATLDFFANHHKNRTAAGEMVIWPTQALETYWCAWKPYFDHTSNQSNCIVNDHPTVVALHVLTERALQLPLSVGTAKERAQWSQMRAILPPVPLIEENGIVSVSPYGSYPINNHLHNGETPEMYSVHPYRYFSVGRSKLGVQRDLSPAQNCLKYGGKVRTTCANAQKNGGWTQGLMNAALLGDAASASASALGRAQTPPGRGYRFMSIFVYLLFSSLFSRVLGPPPTSPRCCAGVSAGLWCLPGSATTPLPTILFGVLEVWHSHLHLSYHLSTSPGGVAFTSASALRS